MRILNRPMFRYGGPIKEGVMHGMRNGGRAALVGNPVYPQTGGREHHNIVKHIKDAPKYIKPGYWGSFARPGTVGGKIKNWWLRNKPSWRTKPGVVSGGTSSARDKYISQTMPPTSTLSKAKSWVKENPWWTAGGVLYGSKPLYETGKATIPAVVKQAADLAVPDWIWDQDKWFKERAEKKAREEAALTAEQKEIERLKKLLEGKTTDEVVDPNAAAKLAKETQNKRLKSYLDMMGYDSAKKGALSDALIDASALVQDATTEAGSIKHADWGNLINKAIQTTSKRLDKPAQIREAVGLMATKAAIEKDLEDPQVKALRALEIKTKEKGLDPSPADLALAASGKTGKVTQDILENIVRSNEGVENFRASFKDKKGTAYGEWLDDNTNGSEMKFMNDIVKKESDFGAGFYVFPDRIVEVKDDLTMKYYY